MKNEIASTLSLTGDFHDRGKENLSLTMAKVESELKVRWISLCLVPSHGYQESRLPNTRSCNCDEILQTTTLNTSWCLAILAASEFINKSEIKFFGVTQLDTFACFCNCLFWISSLTLAARYFLASVIPEASWSANFHEQRWSSPVVKVIEA